MKNQHIEHFLEDSSYRDSKLQEVFNKISNIWQQQNPVTIKRKLSSEVIESVLPERNPIPVVEGTPRRMEVFPYPVSVDFSNFRGGYQAPEDEGDATVTEALARRLEEELRAAKSAQLSCGEVLLPCDLLPRIARDVIRMAENEPCGLRGCTLFVSFEAHDMLRKIGTIKCDPNTVSTFELYLTLKQDSSSWHSLLPQFLKNLTRGGTVMISPGFLLEKKKLYRSYQDQ